MIIICLAIVDEKRFRPVVFTLFRTQISAGFSVGNVRSSVHTLALLLVVRGPVPGSPTFSPFPFHFLLVSSL